MDKLEKPALTPLFETAGAAGWGCCRFADLTLGEGAKEKALALCPGAQGVLVAAFPYYGGDRPGNLSLYARGEDYHQAITRRLTGVCHALEARYPGHTFLPGVDNSPLPERQIARLAGLGIMGRNGLVILPPYGSWIFLGTILTDLPLPSAEEPAPDCLGCSACVGACPGGALREKPFREELCLSALTQVKRPLTPQEEALLKAHPLIWGCDRCQTVCPYNRGAELSPLDDLAGRGEIPYLSTLRGQDVENLTNRSFRETYGRRAFAWRGPAVLRRNLGLKEDK